LNKKSVRYVYLIDFKEKGILGKAGMKLVRSCISHEMGGRLREMKVTWISCMIVATLLLVAGSNVMASDFSCDSKIITIGDYKYDVLRKCGEPSHAEVWQEVLIKKDFSPGLFETGIGLYGSPLFLTGPVTVEEWEYNLGPNRFIRYLRFENSRLIRITEGDYGN
jgi:hypothetical protein